jgi:hypothetical protein
MLRLCECVLDLLNATLNVFSLLISLFVEVATNVGLLFLNLAEEGLSKTFTNDLNKTLGVLGANILSNYAIPALKFKEPLIGHIKICEQRFKIFIEAHLGKVMNITAILNFIDIIH